MPSTNAMGSTREYHLKLYPIEEVVRIDAPPANVMLMPAAMVNQLSRPLFIVKPEYEDILLFFTKRPTITKASNVTIIIICVIVIIIIQTANSTYL